MKKSRSDTASRLFSPRTALAAPGLKIRSLKILDTIAEQVKIRQKTIKHTPIEKLTDALMAILSGAHGLYEVNTRVRSDQALQRAFGRISCAEQSVAQETMNACTGRNLSEMERALNAILRTHSRSFSHDYESGLQLLDVDLRGMPCGKSGELATHCPAKSSPCGTPLTPRRRLLRGVLRNFSRRLEPSPQTPP
jgi:hypothetical protein